MGHVPIVLGYAGYKYGTLLALAWLFYYLNLKNRKEEEIGILRYHALGIEVGTGVDICEGF